MSKLKGLGRVFKRKDSRFWWISLSVRGQESRESSKSVKRADALELLRIRIEQYRLVPGLVRKATVAEILDDYYNDAKLRGVRALLVLGRDVAQLKARIGHVLAMDVDARMVHELTQHFRKAYAAATVNHYTGTLKAALQHAARNGLIAAVPVMPRRLREATPRQGFLEAQDFSAISDELAPWARDVFEFLYHCGWRKNEALTLRWSEVDLAGGVIRLNPERSKNGEGRVLPIVGGIRSVLERRLQQRILGLPWVFHRAGLRVNAQTFHREWKLACKLAGKPELLVHDCRRTAVRNLVRSGVPERVAMEITGHKSSRVFERYNIVDERELAGAVEKLTEYLEQKKTESEQRGQVVPFEGKKR